MNSQGAVHSPEGVEHKKKFLPDQIKGLSTPGFSSAQYSSQLGDSRKLKSQ